MLTAVLAAADMAAAQEEEDQKLKPGRQVDSVAWIGPEIRALVVSMEAHNVFDPNFGPDERSQSWLNVVRDVNEWNEKHPRKNGQCPVRSVSACDNKWRKDLYSAIKKGEAAWQIASGPKEDEDQLMQTFHTLKDQWAQTQRDETLQREAKRLKDPSQTLAVGARQAATKALGPRPKHKREDGESSQVKLDLDNGPGSTRRPRTRRSDASDTALTAAVALMASQHIDAAKKSRAQQQQHEETLRLAERTRELQRQSHRDLMTREDRRLDLEEEAMRRKGELAEKVSKLEDRIGGIESALQASQTTINDMFAFIKTKF